jgi:hypothetical protein
LKDFLLDGARALLHVTALRIIQSLSQRPDALVDLSGRAEFPPLDLALGRMT